MLIRQLRRPVVAWSIGIVAFVGVALFFFLVVPGWVVTTDEIENTGQREKLQNDVRTTAMQLLAGTVLGLGVYFTARTIALNREGQITERFSVQLGGIYALERIARDSRRDHVPIMEILTAYVRVESPANTHDLPGGKRAEIRAAMTVIGRRNLANERHRPPLALDLSWTDLRDGDWTFAHLERALFSKAHLEDADFTGACLEGADLSGADLSGASFEEVIVDEETKWPRGFDPPPSARKVRT